MSGYTKLFSSILASTVWREPDRVRILWITMLAMADKSGMVEASLPGLADFARIPVEACEDALARLSGPDKHSRSQAHAGARIKAVDGGWQVLNHSKYREKLNADERRDYNRIMQAKYRAVKKASTEKSTVNDGHGRSIANTQSAHIAEAEAEAEAEAKKKNSAPAARPAKTADPRVKQFLEWFLAQYKTQRHGAAYLIRWEKDAPLVKKLLAATDYERLQQCARILLSEKTDDEFIVQTDRGIGILAARFNWLSDRLATWEETQRKAAQ